jgi:hypothetical protein
VEAFSHELPIPKTPSTRSRLRTGSRYFFCGFAYIFRLDDIFVALKISVSIRKWRARMESRLWPSSSIGLKPTLHDVTSARETSRMDFVRDSQSPVSLLTELFWRPDQQNCDTKDLPN